MADDLHVAIIMDGSGRWAKKRGMPRVFGHRQGAEAIRDVVNASPDLGVKYVTLFTFSTENWQRPKDEVDYLMSMLEEMLYKETPGLHKENVRINAIGRIGDLYEPARKSLSKALETTKDNSGLVLTFCLSYGGRSEIVDAVKKIVQRDRKNRIDLDSFGEDDLNGFLYDPKLPAPDLLIRTGADNRTRISNFLLWEIAYAELYFTKTLWPDFRKKEYAKAIDDFRTRERLFGKIK